MKRWLIQLAVALALIPTVGAAQNLDENGQTEPSVSSVVAIFELPDGKEPTFYADKYYKLASIELPAAIEDASLEEAKELYRRFSDVAKRIAIKLADEEDDYSKRATVDALTGYVSGLVYSDQIDALKNAQNDELIRERPKALEFAKTSLEQLETLQRRFVRQLTVINPLKKACANKDAEAASRLGNALAREATEYDDFAKVVFIWIDQIKALDPETARIAEHKVVDAFMKSEDKERKENAELRIGMMRFEELKGKELRVEGLYPDGEEIDWSQFRGKVVLIDFWATWCAPCLREFPNALRLYSKYHASGFEIVGYAIDDDLDALDAFLKKIPLPWKTLSLQKSLDAKAEGGKDYLDLATYYGIRSIPRMILVDRDGKVIDAPANGMRLEELLQEAFPDVKDAQDDEAYQQAYDQTQIALYNFITEKYQKALAENNDDFNAVDAMIRLASEFRQWADTALYMERAIKMRSDDFRLLANNALFLAACPKSELRDGKLALERAQTAMKLAGAPGPGIFHSLACAYAELGDFQNAVDWEQKACDDLDGNPRQRSCLKALELFKAGKPYRFE